MVVAASVESVSRKANRVKVHRCGKQSNEFSALYVGQDVKAHDGVICAMSFSPDGQYLVTGGEDGMVRTVKVSNVSLGASERDIKEFSFSGEIEYIEMKRYDFKAGTYFNSHQPSLNIPIILLVFSGDERSQIAYVPFIDPQGVETALLLSGATIVDMSVTIALAEDYQLPVAGSAPMTDDKAPSGAEGVVQKAEDVVSTMLAKGFVTGKDVLNRAKNFDDKHQLTSTTSVKVVSLDQKIGLSEKVSMGTSAVNEKMKGVDQRFRVSEKTKSASTAAEQTVSNAGSAVMKNGYVLTGATWVIGAFNRVVKAAGDVGSKTKEKVSAEEEHKRGTSEPSSVPKPPSDI